MEPVLAARSMVYRSSHCLVRRKNIGKLRSSYTVKTEAFRITPYVCVGLGELCKLYQSVANLGIIFCLCKSLQYFFCVFFIGGRYFVWLWRKPTALGGDVGLRGGVGRIRVGR